MALEDDEPKYRGPPYSEPYYDYMEENVSLTDLSCLCMTTLVMQSLSGFILVFYGFVILIAIAVLSFGFQLFNMFLLLEVWLMPIGIIQFIMTYRLFKRRPSVAKFTIILNILAIILLVIFMVNIIAFYGYVVFDQLLVIALGANILSPILFQMSEVKGTFYS